MGFLDGDHFDDQECLTLLSRSQFGRVALSMRALPVIVPVRYSVIGTDIRLSVSDDQLAQALDGQVACVQADGFDEDHGQRWTVFATGPVSRIGGLQVLGTLPSTAPGESALDVERERAFSLQAKILSGRWITQL